MGETASGINWEIHPDPSPIWFPTEAVFNKYTNEPTLQEYIEKYVFGAQTQKEVTLKNEKDPNKLSGNSVKHADEKTTIPEKNEISKTIEPKGCTESQQNKDSISSACHNPVDIKALFREILAEVPWPHPCSSVISRKEQKFYIEKFIKFRLKNPEAPYDTRILEKVKQLDMKIKQEQAQVQSLLQKYAKTQPEKYLFLLPALKERIKTSLQRQIEKTQSKFKEAYELEKTISLTSGVAFHSDPVMSHVKTIRNQNNIHSLKIPEVKSCINHDIFATVDPFTDSSLQDKQQSEKLLHLSREHNIDLVMSSRSLITLVNNQAPEFLKTWKVPVEIKRINKDNKESKNVILFGNPLPPNVVSTRQANFLYFREALRETMKEPTQFIKLQTNNTSDVTECQEMAGKEGFQAVSSGNPDEKSSRKSAVKTGQLEGNSTENEMRSIDKDEVDSRVDVCKKEPNNNAKDILTGQEEPEGNAKDVPTGQVKPHQSSTDLTGNLDIWKLGKTNILVRSSCDGYAMHQNNRAENDKQAYVIFPKIEYQSKFGVEEFSIEELTTAWWDSFICKDSKLLCLRVEPQTGQLVRSEVYEHGSLVGPNCPFSPKASMKLLHNILKEVVSNGEGSYMLVHNAGDIHACFYRRMSNNNNKSSSGYRITNDYNTTYENWPIKDVNVPWLPIDTNIILPDYMETNRLPCLFPVAGELNIPNQDVPGNKPGTKKREEARGNPITKSRKRKAKQLMKMLEKSSKIQDPRSRMDVKDYGDLDLDF